MTDTPEAVVNAIARPNQLTLGKLAVFEKIQTPLLRGNISKLTENIKAIWIYDKPIEEVSKHFDDMDEQALIYADTITPEQYEDKLCAIIEGIASFFGMMPPPDESKKASVGSATDGLQS